VGERKRTKLLYQRKGWGHSTGKMFLRIAKGEDPEKITVKQGADHDKPDRSTVPNIRQEKRPGGNAGGTKAGENQKKRPL